MESQASRVSPASRWVSRVFSARFFWWAAKGFLFPSVSFVILYLILAIKDAPFSVWIDVVARQEILIVAISPCVTTLFDLTSDALVWPHSRRGVVSFVLLFFFILICAGGYGALAGQVAPVSPSHRATIVSWIGGLTLFAALFVQVVVAPQPSVAKAHTGGA